MAIGTAAEGKTFRLLDGLRFVLDLAAVLDLAILTESGSGRRGGDVSVSVDGGDEELREGCGQRDDLDEG